jgi:NADH-quinone oxidoreductase subunit L
MAQAHEIVRVQDEPRLVDGEKYFVADPAGTQVILWPDHFHAPIAGEDGKQLIEAEPHGDKVPTMPLWLLVLAGLGIFTGCVGKSAQFPLSVWLPDAMEGPTPVSALIHAATMVAAGVYLVGRVYPLFTEEVRLIIAYVGGITLFVAATIAIVQTDIKKVLAYSTVSQLGYMMLALGVGGWAVGLFHLITHAFFKALLFLGSGSVIFGCHHEQDMSKMGGLFKKMPITALTMLVGCLAIMGFPLTAGWYSKDGIIAHAMGFARANPAHLLLFLLPLVTAGITTFYMFRMWFLTFTGEPRDAHVHQHASETPYVMTVPLIILAVCSIAVGWPGMQFGKKSADAHHAATEGHEEESGFRWPLLDASQSSLEGHIHHAQHPGVNAEFGDPHAAVTDEALKREAHFTHELHNAAGGLALLSAGLGFIFAWVIYRRNALDPAEAEQQFPGVRSFLWNKWYFDELYSVLLVRPSLVIAGWCRAFDAYVIDGIIHGVARLTVLTSKWDGKFDNGVVDGLVNLTARVLHGIGGWFRTWQTGYVRSYVLFLVLAAISLFALLVIYARQVAAG